MDAAEAHQQLSQVTGALPVRPSQLAARPVSERLADMGVKDPSLNDVAAAFGHATAALEQFAGSVQKLVDVAEELVDDDGREIWLTAGEVELDQWATRLTDAAADVRRQLSGSGWHPEVAG